MLDTQPDGDDDQSINRRRLLRATATSVTALAGLGVASSSTSASTIPCACTEEQENQCGANEECVCEEIPGGAHTGPIRRTECVSTESDVSIECEPDDPEDMTIEELESSPTYTCS